MSVSILNLLLFGNYEMSRVVLIEDEDRTRPEDNAPTETMYHYWYDVYFEPSPEDQLMGTQVIQLTISAECWNTYLASKWDYPVVEIQRQHLSDTVMGTTPETILSHAAPLSGGPRYEPMPARFEA